LLDPLTGEVPNLGHNDGAFILPLTVCAYRDYRPVLQASSRAFLGAPAISPGPWDEMSAWFGVWRSETANASSASLDVRGQEKPMVLQSPSGRGWAYLRAARFTSRPAHADQLHLDLWWCGLNLALDPGTYLYNAPPPWENSLRATRVHNTITVDDQDQMTPAGRFLWLNWAQAELCEPPEVQWGSSSRISARHAGYNRLGVAHRRTAAFENEARLVVEDSLLPVKGKFSATTYTFCLHWLLPDWPWEGLDALESDGHLLRLKSPFGWVHLRVVLPISPAEGQPAPLLSARLVRAGELIAGGGPVEPTLGWFSPTYAHKIPALSLSFRWNSRAPSFVNSEWTFPD
jgi:hypothetical protein